MYLPFLKNKEGDFLPLRCLMTQYYLPTFLNTRRPIVTTITAPAIGNATGIIEPIADKASVAIVVMPSVNAVVTVCIGVNTPSIRFPFRPPITRTS